MNTLRQMHGMQLAIAILALLTICSLLFGTIGTIVLDIIGDDPGPVSFDDVTTSAEIGQALMETATAAPGNPAAAIALANYTAQSAGIGEAIPLYEIAIALDLENPDFRLDFARSLSDAGYSADAELQFKKAIALNPASPFAHYYLGRLYQFSDPPRINDAITEYEQTVMLGPETFVADKARQALIDLGVASPVASPATAQ